jgi:CRISPR-associated protein Csd1
MIRMPGTKGAMLVSFNEPSACLRGADQGANAPVSRAAAEGYVTALNWMLERAGPDRRHRQAVSLGDGSVLVYWTRNPHAVLEAVPELVDAVADLVSVPWRSGPRSRVNDDTTFYAAVLATNKTRIVVRDWIQTTVDDLRAALDAFASDLRLDTDTAPIPSIGSLLRALRNPPPNAGGQIFRTAIRGGPFPRWLLGAVLRALASGDGVALRTRSALIKAILMRLPRVGGPRTVPMALDETTLDVPYLLGRLFAVLEQMQWSAHGATVNSTVRDRYQRAAASTPAMVFPRLLDLSSHHAAKIARRGRGAYLEKLKEHILDGLPALPFPRTLSLEDQGLFVIGYYHQRQHLFQRGDAAKQENLETSTQGEVNGADHASVRLRPAVRRAGRQPERRSGRGKRSTRRS